MKATKSKRAREGNQADEIQTRSGRRVEQPPNAPHPPVLDVVSEAVKERTPRECALAALSPVEMRSFLADSDGKWLDRSWEDVLHRMPTSLGSSDQAILTTCHTEKNLKRFMLVYTPAFNDSLHTTPRFECPMTKMTYFQQCVELRDETPLTDDDNQCTGFVTRIGKYERHHFAMSTRARREYWTRYLPMDVVPIRPRSDKGVEAELTDTPSLLTVLAGESGSGKTALILRSKHGLYFTAGDFPGNDAHVGNDPVTGEVCEPRSDAFKTYRNKYARETVTGKIVHMITTVAPNMNRYSGNLDLVIALDEMVVRPNLVRSLCARMEDITKAVGKYLSLGDGCTLTLTFVVAGTGMDTPATRPGSLPSTYRVLTMPASDEMPKHLVKLIRDIGLQGHEFLARVIEKSPDAKELAKNPRFAAALLAEVQMVNVDVIGSMRSAEALLPFLLQMSANKYKSRNGMHDLTEDDVRRIYQTALRLVFNREGPPRVDDDAVTQLVGKFGVVVDRARWFLEWEKAYLVKRGNIIWNCDKEGNALMSPPFRYEMSAAQQLLFRMHYGVHALPEATWYGYEVLIANYLEAAALGCHGCTLKHLLTCLNPSAKWHTQPSDEGRAERLKKPLAYNGVVVLQSRTRITGTTPAAALKDIHKHVKANRAVVVVNADKAPFADVMLIIPDTALVLVQCKFYKDATPLSAGQIEEELEKLSTVSSLLKVAGAGAEVVPVIATRTKEDVGVTDSDAYLLWTPTTRVPWNAKPSLAPLAITMPERLDERPDRVEVSMH